MGTACRPTSLMRMGRTEATLHASCCTKPRCAGAANNPSPTLQSGWQGGKQQAHHAVLNPPHCAAARLVLLPRNGTQGASPVAMRCGVGMAGFSLVRESVTRDALGSGRHDVQERRRLTIPFGSYMNRHSFDTSHNYVIVSRFFVLSP